MVWLLKTSLEWGSQSKRDCRQNVVGCVCVCVLGESVCPLRENVCVERESVCVCVLRERVHVCAPRHVRG